MRNQNRNLTKKTRNKNCSARKIWQVCESSLVT